MLLTVSMVIEYVFFHLVHCTFSSVRQEIILLYLQCPQLDKIRKTVHN